MIFLYKILNGLAPKYLFDILSVSKNQHYSTRNQSNLELSQFFTWTKSFSNSFFPYCFKELNKLDTKIKYLSSLCTFKKVLLAFCKTEENSLFNVHNPIGVKYLNRLRLNFSHLNEHKSFTIISRIQSTHCAVVILKLYWVIVMMNFYRFVIWIA